MEGEPLFQADLFMKFAIAFGTIVNPLLSIPLFLQMTKEFSHVERRRAAHIIAITIFIAACAIMVVGEEFLSFFGISISGFQIAGGIFILMLGLSILNGKEDKNAVEPSEVSAATNRSILIVPLTIPIMFGPGAITTIVIFTQYINDVSELVSMVPAVALICVLIWLGLLFAAPIERFLGYSAMSVITRIMGLLLTAIAVEMVIAGVLHVTKSNFFPSMLSGGF